VLEEIMADNVIVSANVGVGATVATDDISGVQYQRVKVTLGADGVSDGDVSSANPMPVSLSTAQVSVMYSPEYAVQHEGTLSGVAAALYHIMGSRTLGWSSTSVLGDACEYLDTSQALMNTPTTGQTLYLVSTSASDTAAGTGARTVRIVYLDSNGLQQVRTDTLNGTTPVSIGTGYSFIQWMEVASLGSAEVSAGNITISSTNGAATVATTFEYIKAGGNRSLSGRYMIPSDCHGHLIHWDAAAIANTMDTRIRATVFADDNSLSSVYHFIDRAFIASGENITQGLEYRSLPANSVVKVSAIPGGAPAGNKLDCSFSLIVMAT
jgi:hypothetical protein